MEEQQDLLKKQVGNIDLPKLEPKDVQVQGIKSVDKSTDSKKFPPLVVFICKHPDKEDLIELSNIKILKEDKLKVTALWLKEDAEGDIQKGSAISILLNAYDVQCLGDLVGTNVHTVKQNETNDYLCIKGY